MFNTDFLLKILKREKVSHYIYTLLFISLLTIGDFLTLILFSELIGIYLYLGIIASICFIGIGLVVKFLKGTITTIENKHDNGTYPKNDFYKFTGLLLAAILIVFPGLVTTTIGLVILIPIFRQLVGRTLTKRLKLDWYAAYEYKEIYS